MPRPQIATSRAIPPSVPAKLPRPALEPLLLTDDEAAVLLGVSRRTVTSLASSGKLTAIHPAGMRMRRFARTEILALVDQWLRDAKGEEPAP
jgi:excisionase family DNA binding protein